MCTEVHATTEPDADLPGCCRVRAVDLVVRMEGLGALDDGRHQLRAGVQRHTGLAAVLDLALPPVDRPYGRDVVPCRSQLVPAA
jgi:hypothetical protein